MSPKTMDAHNKFEFIIKNFNNNVSDVYKILVLDDLILKNTIQILEDRQKNLRNSGIENAFMLGENAIQQLKNIRSNESIKPGYKLIHNQCVILLVSYFSSSMHDLFNTAATMAFKGGISKKIRSNEIKFTIDELKSYDFDLSDEIGSIISKKFDISFQDMGSISRALKDYLEVEIPWDKTVNNIITMQACRHAIAHAGETVDERLINQLRNSKDRDIQKSLSVGQRVQFTPEEVKKGGEEMKKYMSSVVNKLLAPT